MNIQKCWTISGIKARTPHAGRAQWLLQLPVLPQHPRVRMSPLGNSSPPHQRTRCSCGAQQCPHSGQRDGASTQLEQRAGPGLGPWTPCSWHRSQPRARLEPGRLRGQRWELGKPRRPACSPSLLLTRNMKDVSIVSCFTTHFSLKQTLHIKKKKEHFSSWSLKAN